MHTAYFPHVSKRQEQHEETPVNQQIKIHQKTFYLLVSHKDTSDYYYRFVNVNKEYVKSYAKVDLVRNLLRLVDMPLISFDPDEFFLITPQIYCVLYTLLLK